eukprot:TRINITY_DN700_c0_g2_i4.p1 TRINITY_DN700_c0_g2~~TRINITY_DN700_c0_g2_i4.p1  ORF type:complete len:1144 (-),score=456.35 TRINITY_DN700_c0_g2_i4:184-3615(-)
MSLLDEFDDIDSDRSLGPGFSNSAAEDFVYDGFVGAPKVEEDEPMFALERVNFKVNGIIHMVACNHAIVLALKNGHIMRFDDRDGSTMEDIEISRRPDERIHKLFLDPSGTHLLISMDNDESYYVNRAWKKAKPVPKLKSSTVDAVAWQPGGVAAAEPGCTRDILLGTSRGRIFETGLDVSERAFAEGAAALLLGGAGASGGPGGGRKEWPCKALYTLPDGRPVVGLRYERFASTDNQPRKYFVMAATASRLYQFIGGPTFEALFAYYEINPISFQDMPGGLAKSTLALFSKYQLPKSFAWLTGQGILYGDLIFGSQNAGDTVTTDTALLAYPPPPPRPASAPAPGLGLTGAAASAGGESQQQQQPIGVALGEFHFVLLYDDRLCAINVLDQRVVWQHPLQPRLTGAVRGLAHDTQAPAADGAATSTIWVYCESSVHELIVSGESRDVWRLYMQQQQFELALHYCANAAQRDQVWTAQAEHYMSAGRFRLAGTCFGKTARPLEDVALRLLSVGDERDALQHYLETKLDSMRQQAGAQLQPTQMTLLASWLTEIYLDNLSSSSGDGGHEPTAGGSGGGGERTEGEGRQQQQRVRTVVRDDFELFLQTYRDQLDRATTYTLIASHGQTALLLYYAALCGDHERVIAHHLQHDDPQRALDLLGQLPLAAPGTPGGGDDRVQQLYYKFSPPLFQLLPAELVNAWMASAPGALEPRKLLPALMRFDDAQPDCIGVEQAIRYLAYCVDSLSVTDAALHNYLLSLYARRTDQPAPLLHFISRPERHFEPKYALRVCTEHGQVRACVRLYSMLGLYEEAVDLALAHGDLDEAKLHADLDRLAPGAPAAAPDVDALSGVSSGTGGVSSGGDELALRKKLWLKIARHLVEHEKDIKRAMQLLGQQSAAGSSSGDQLVKIEDILPFFPEFTRIDDFKHEICASLEDYNRHIEQLKREMDSATRSAELIRQDIADLRNKYGYVESSQRCGLCKYPALCRDFYLFPCEHAFHADCLRAEMLRHLPAAQCQRIAYLSSQLEVAADNQQPPQPLLPQPVSSAVSSLRKRAAAALPVSTSSDAAAAAGSEVDAAAAAGSAAAGGSGGAGLARLSRLEALKEQLDEMLAYECPLCGSLMIQSISVPFVDRSDPEAHLWAL